MKKERRETVGALIREKAEPMMIIREALSGFGVAQVQRRPEYAGVADRCPIWPLCYTPQAHTLPTLLSSLKTQDHGS